MEQWLESVYSDGTRAFVSEMTPNVNNKVTISIRLYADAPVKHILLRTMPNGDDVFTEMKRYKIEHGLAWYSATVKMNEKRLPYQFYLVCEDRIYFYTQRGISDYVPDESSSFVLLADYVQPEWVKEAVFYQIFPERFCNGDTSNDVESGEYKQLGHPTIKMANWNDVPLSYQDGRCLDFFGGDLQGIKEKIPYLKELGVTAVYLNPIFVAPSVHKYDCLDYFHVDPHFGGDEALADLCSALHKNGMKIILDISINHTGMDHVWFNRDCAFFDKSIGAYNNPESREREYYFFGKNNTYHGWKGIETLPTLNYTSEALRDVIYRSEDSVLKKWLKPPYSIDGWRFDVANTFARNNELQLAQELWPEIRKSIRSVNPQAYVLAEEWGDCAGYLQGDAWDSPMNYFGCGRVIREFLGEQDLVLAWNPILKGVHKKLTAENFKNRVMEHLARIPYVMWENQFNLFDSHDASRLHNNPAVHPDEYRGAVIFQFILPGAASIYYGDEAEIDGTIETTEGCRYTMPWGRDFTKTEAYVLNRTMAKMKAENKALSHGGMKFLYAKDGVVAIARFLDEKVFVGIISNNDHDVEIRLPLGAVGASRPISDEDVFGKTLSYKRADENSILLSVPAHQAYFIECSMK